MNDAYESTDAARAQRLLENLAARLEGEHPGVLVQRERDRPVIG
jgi:hypothetical protein